jgi:hypothetical protein
MVSYIPTLRPVTVDFGYLTGENFSVSWFDPRTGAIVKEITIKDKKVNRLQSPTGEDMVLIIKSL